MKEYLELLKDIKQNGRFKLDRTGTGCYSVFGRQLRFDLSGNQFPLVTTKKTHLKSIIHELLWILKGSTNNNDLKEVGVSIWNEWAKDDGDLGPIYGKQWRAWEGKNGRIHDQIANAVELLKKDPGSRRNVVSAWNVDELDQMSLNPCHSFFQFFADLATPQERLAYAGTRPELEELLDKLALKPTTLDLGQYMDDMEIPKYRVSCQLYQRKQYCAIAA